MQVKKILKWGAIGMAAFYLVRRPEDAAQTVHGAFDGMMSAANSMAQFFATLT
ncbi:hypothetical protein N5079_31430 [Planotetraspora sp. A-T 1434]|uniref:hypothetical protein n=1 Tax=Planotetraspora sp. A-T 1434 TaxID=2979219 RepID=UPI0021BEE7ED|nr:hypothetical protein [Planotetraspora sp. A-T 1434]MCT9934730.1 hypothetical protein [Planotetraspora sp. A-T 1434]